MKRTHKPPRGSLVATLSEKGSLRKFNHSFNHNMSPQDYTDLLLDHGFDLFSSMNTYEISRYLMSRPTDIILEKSVLNFLESQPFEDQIKVPDSIKGQVWVSLEKLGLTTANGTKVIGILFVKPSPYRRYYYTRQIEAQRGGVSLTPEDGDVYGAWIMCGRHSLNYNFTSNTTFHYLLESSYKATNPIKETSGLDIVDGYEGMGRPLAIALMALQLIDDGHFTKDVSVFEHQSMPLTKKRLKSKGNSKRGKFKQKYREFRTSTFRHVDSEPQPTERSRSYTPPDHHTPRNVRSHYKERWVTVDYIEKHNIPDDDIIDLEDKTRLYKNGANTKLWAKIKLWFEYEQDPDLEPAQEIERYRV